MLGISLHNAMDKAQRVKLQSYVSKFVLPLIHPHRYRLIKSSQEYNGGDLSY